MAQSAQSAQHRYVKERSSFLSFTDSKPRPCSAHAHQEIERVLHASSTLNVRTRDQINGTRPID